MIYVDDLLDLGKQRQQRERGSANQHFSLATLCTSSECFWDAAWLCIRLWFTSALCDHQNIQFTLTAEAWSGHAKQLRL